MEGACSVHGRYKKCIHNFGRGKSPLGKLGVCGRIILKCILNRIGGSGVDSSRSGYSPVTGFSEHVMDLHAP
jgi:hypothetical protein